MTTSEPWAEHPASCVFQPNINPLGPFRDVWVCHGLPPGEWPLDRTLTPSQIGPVDTTYTFSVGEYAARLALLAARDTAALAQGVAFWHAPPILPGIANFIWTIAPTGGQPVTIDVLRATIHAKVGTLEESCNVLHYISDPEVAIDPAMVNTFAAKVALNWAAFMVDQPAGSLPGGPSMWHALFAKTANYDEVRAAHVQIVGSTVKWAPGTQTVYAPIIATAGQGPSLPAQVACTVTLHSGVRAGKKGRSGRGRIYLGPLSSNIIDPLTGTFIAGLPQSLGAAWKKFMVTAMHTGAAPFSLVVLSPATNARYVVTDVAVGQVPDTQRRRRKSLPELYVTV
jgi:hypothetical protein